MAASLDTETAAMETEGRAPLASQEATATPAPAPAPALCGQVSEFTRGKEFKVRELRIYWQTFIGDAQKVHMALCK